MLKGCTMLETPMDVQRGFPVRKTKRQKQNFREAVKSYASAIGYESRVEKGSLGSRNLVIGNPERADYLVTAHYDTCACLPIPNLLTPCSFWLFLLWQVVLTILILVVCALIGLVSGLISGDASIGVRCGYLMIWVLLAIMLIGPANSNNANDNTSGVVTLLEIAKSMPKNRRERVAFVLFDLEEAGLIGSASYRKSHKSQTDRQLVLNLDCVGDGDFLTLFPGKKVKADKKRVASLRMICGGFGKKRIQLKEKGFAFYPSDQANFPLGVGICALNKRKGTLYLSKIHTKKDTTLERTNVNLLRAALISLICRDAAQ